MSKSMSKYTGWKFLNTYWLSACNTLMIDASPDGSEWSEIIGWLLLMEQYKWNKLY